MVHSPSERSTLSSGHNNPKIGRDVRKGKLFRGFWLYTLSLEERATCPRACAHWTDCYLNNSPLTKRMDHRDPDLLMDRLQEDVCDLISVRGRVGVLVRLHGAGDFFSEDYVNFWSDMLDELPRLACYGYTAHPPDSDMGRVIERARRRHGPRFAVRWSNGGLAAGCTVTVPDERSAPPGSFVCPEQTGRTRACATCAACWETDRNVAFLKH